MPKFSVVIPLYDKGPHIERAVRSVLAQTFGDFELIVVDDGSTDAGPAKVRAIADPRLRLLTQVNAGVSAARNAGANAARAPFIAFLDADDVWEPDFLRCIRQMIREFPEGGLFCTGYVLRRDGRDARPKLAPGYSDGPTRAIAYFEGVSAGDMIATASSVCIPARVMQEVGGFAVGERVGEDQDLWARIALRYPIILNPRVLMAYHQDTTNMATRCAPQREAWPFITRLAARLEAGAIDPALAPAVQRYLARQLAGQASQLVLAGDGSAARRLLSNRICRQQPLRRRLWWALSMLPARAVQVTYRAYARARAPERSLSSSAS